MQILFTNPNNLWFLLFLPVVIAIHFLGLRSTRQRALRFANYEAINKVTGKTGARPPMRVWQLVSRLLVVVFLVLAVSGATIRYVGEASQSDYVIALDGSASMLAEDLTPNRFDAAKSAALAFIDALPPRAKVGLVTFSGSSLARIAPTEDLGRVKREISGLQIEEAGGTAIGEAVLTSSNLLQNTAASRTIVLLTDGQSNVGMPVEDAVAYARNLSIVVHTIGIGTAKGGTFGGVGVVSTLDSDSLRKISEDTGGEFFLAGDSASLKQGFVAVAKANSRVLETDLTGALLLVSLVLISLEWALGLFRYVRLEW